MSRLALFISYGVVIVGAWLLQALLNAYDLGECDQFQDVNRVYDWQEEGDYR